MHITNNKELLTTNIFYLFLSSEKLFLNLPKTTPKKFSNAEKNRKEMSENTEFRKFYVRNTQSKIKLGATSCGKDQARNVDGRPGWSQACCLQNTPKD